MKQCLLISCLVTLAVMIVPDVLAQTGQADPPVNVEALDAAPGGGALITDEPETLDEEPSSEVIDQQAQSAYAVQGESIPLGEVGVDDEASGE